MKKRIIHSLLDTDLYKFTMQQVVLHRFPSAVVEYKFVCRTKGVDLAQIHDRLKEEIEHLCSLTFTKEELDYLRTFRFLKDDYVDYLEDFKLHSRYITLKPNHTTGEIELRIKGPWVKTILFEVPLLAIISEIHGQLPDVRAQASDEVTYQRLDEKMKKIDEYASSLPVGEVFRMSDFGTRRRHAREWQDVIVCKLSLLARQNPRFVFSTSNVYLSMKYGLTCQGTMAHEYLQAMQAMVQIRQSQKHALENWVQEYRGDLGIALTDVINMDSFLRDFDLYFAKLFDGCRHDSGDPNKWCSKLVDHYIKLKINPKTKTAVFSDGLNIDKAIDLHKGWNSVIETAFGIGTNLTNDIGYKALSIVIKMVICNGEPVAKISDEPTKGICESPNFVVYLGETFSH